MAPPAPLSGSDFHSEKETVRASAGRHEIDSADSDRDAASDAAIPDAPGKLEMDCDADSCGGGPGRLRTLRDRYRLRVKTRGSDLRYVCEVTIPLVPNFSSANM